MNPAVDVRIGGLIRVLDKIVVPALPAGIARDQAALVAGHLRVLREQVDFAARYELLQLCAARCLAQELLAVARGGERTTSAVDTLAEHVAAPVPAGTRSVRDCYLRTIGAIEDLVRACGSDGEQSVIPAVNRCVLRHGRDQALREREWFSGMGFESSLCQSLPAMMDRFDAQYGDGVQPHSSGGGA
ncbi:hypothetical protein ABT124_41750 [Streptomyces sp. NPDC001982]|uniref:hypothetical protein n=1 Tax=Streptomyces sp. NPDC001982 TaxID=3154405 RepID=UPI00331AC74E